MAEPTGADPPQINGQLAGQSDDGFLACGPGGQCAFSQALIPFAYGAVVGLESDHSPG